MYIVEGSLNEVTTFFLVLIYSFIWAQNKKKAKTDLDLYLTKSGRQ